MKSLLLLIVSSFLFLGCEKLKIEDEALLLEEIKISNETLFGFTAESSVHLGDGEFEELHYKFIFMGTEYTVEGTLNEESGIYTAEINYKDYFDEIVGGGSNIQLIFAKSGKSLNSNIVDVKFPEIFEIAEYDGTYYAMDTKNHQMLTLDIEGNYEVIVNSLATDPNDQELDYHGNDLLQGYDLIVTDAKIEYRVNNRDIIYYLERNKIGEAWGNNWQTFDNENYYAGFGIAYNSHFLIYNNYDGNITDIYSTNYFNYSWPSNIRDYEINNFCLKGTEQLFFTEHEIFMGYSLFRWDFNTERIEEVVNETGGYVRFIGYNESNNNLLTLIGNTDLVEFDTESGKKSVLRTNFKSQDDGVWSALTKEAIYFVVFNDSKATCYKYGKDGLTELEIGTSMKNITDFIEIDGKDYAVSNGFLMEL